MSSNQYVRIIRSTDKSLINGRYRFHLWGTSAYLTDEGAFPITEAIIEDLDSGKVLRMDPSDIRFATEVTQAELDQEFHDRAVALCMADANEAVRSQY